MQSLKDASVQLYLDFIDKDGKWISNNITEHTQPSNGTFMTFNLTGQVPANAVAVKVYGILRSLKDGATGTMYVDDLHFEHITSKERTHNSSFESFSNGDEIANGWKKENWGAARAHFQVQKFNDRIVQCIEGKGIGHNGIAAISQSVKMTPNQPYLLKGSLNVLSLNNAKVQLYMDFYDKNDRHLGVNIIDHL
ncbi:hypothetical protein [Paenibacillus sp. 481]|uniref:hypothetical protein n=1 Tax=Paenibacillus sp. 481 TaxID=2835869 RepID=UPI001E327023|nr:hypothetical protein [Paenibacillus sp. 481]UHA73718.1 hypothetical protein KIK04_00640 [Paenibacillus sp. 481]